MTVTRQDRTVLYRGNGATVLFSYPFTIPQMEMLYVYLVNWDTKRQVRQLSPSEFSVTGIGSPSGGAVRYPISGTPLAQDTGILILRTVPYTQEADILNEDGFYPEVVEQALDHIVYQTQQLAERLGHTVTVPEGSVPPIWLVQSGNLIYVTPTGEVVSSITPPDEAKLRADGDAMLAQRIDGIVGEVAAQVDLAKYYAGIAEAGAEESRHHAEVSHRLVEDAVAGFLGFTDGMAYDFGWIADPMTYFNRDWGTI